MSPDEVRLLEKKSKKLKRIASEWASKLHDLVEDRLPAAYEEIPTIADATYAACEDWAKCMAELECAKAKLATPLEEAT